MAEAIIAAAMEAEADAVRREREGASIIAAAMEAEAGAVRREREGASIIAAGMEAEPPLREGALCGMCSPPSSRPSPSIAGQPRGAQDEAALAHGDSISNDRNRPYSEDEIQHTSQGGDSSRSLNDFAKESSPSNHGYSKVLQKLGIINYLPIEIVCIIVSKLPVKDAARAAVVCKKFCLSWYFHPALAFTLGDQTSRLTIDPICTRIINHVDPMESLILEGVQPDDDSLKCLNKLNGKTSTVSVIIRCAIPCFVPGLSMLYTLRNLVLEKCIIKLEDGGVFPFLSNVTLDSCQFPNTNQNDMQQLVSLCPRLVDLKLIFPVFFKNASYQSTNLKLPMLHSLVIMAEDHTMAWELYAPKISNVKLCMDPALCFKILPNCSNVEILTIQAWTLPIGYGKPCSFQNLITLVLEVFFDKNCMNAVLDLIEAAPILEDLKLKSYDPGTWKESDLFWQRQSRKFSSKLRTVEVEGFAGTHREVDLIRFILYTVEGVEKLVVRVDEEMEEVDFASLFYLEDEFRSIQFIVDV